jgi:hypothetical protein
MFGAAIADDISTAVISQVSSDNMDGGRDSSVVAYA